jgi:hypothetical protein
MRPWRDRQTPVGCASELGLEQVLSLRSFRKHPAALADVLINQQQDYVTTITATPALGLIKCSLLIQYYTIFKPLRWLRICVWIGAVISVTFYVAVSITALVLESPWHGEGLIGDILSSHYLEFSKFSVPTGVIGTTLDLYLLVLPVPAVLTLKMSPAKKLGILVVFTTGGL